MAEPGIATPLPPAAGGSIAPPPAGTAGGHAAADAEAAWHAGIRAAGAGDFLPALQWLERAVRLAPDDPRIALDLANIRLRAGGEAQLRLGAAAFEALTAQHDVAAGWVGLLAARRLLGQHAAAAAALRELLGRHCIPEDRGFREIAGAIAAAAGAPGWCGIDAAGRLHFAAAGEVTGDCDGAAFAPLQAGSVQAGDVPPGGSLSLRCAGTALLGSPLDPAAFRRCDGLVALAGAALHGWASRPAAPGELPWLTLRDAAGRLRRIAIGALLPAQAETPLTPRYEFRCPVSMLLGLSPPFHVLGGDGADISGSPVDPRAELAAVPIPAFYAGPANRRLPPKARLRVVVPVYRGLAATAACLEAVLRALPEEAGLIVVDDAAPETELRGWLDSFCRQNRVNLIRHAENKGFPAAANSGLAAAAGCDVLLLNSDTLLPPGALRTMLSALYADAATGSVTPFANEATICSYPRREGGTEAPDLAAAIGLDAMAAAANGGQTVDIPTGVGCCLLMRHDCLEKTGFLRSELFAQGYGEEVDWCLRARHFGYRHKAATGAYVAHLGRVSFKAAGHALNARNNALLMRLHPGYAEFIGAHLAADPLAAARARLDAARFAAGRRASAVLLISHRQGGGVKWRVTAEMRRIRAAGERPILLYPAGPDIADGAELTDDAEGDYPNLRFVLPGQEAGLLALLRTERIGRVVLHHGLGHHPGVRSIAGKLGCPQDIVLHDYASFCPQVHLIDAARRYCGEPDVQACIACVAAAGDATGEELGPVALRARSAAEFASARSIATPSADAARRIARQFPGVNPRVTPWEDDAWPLPLGRPGPPGAARRIAVLGGIGFAKGYDILLACAGDAARRLLPLDFVLAGSSFDDARLLATGRVFVTGPYRQAGLPELLGGLRADLAFIPSVWPETWCFTLSEAWAAGLPALAFDLGAQAERIAASGRGGLLPLGLPPGRVNDALLAWQPAAIPAQRLIANDRTIGQDLIQAARPQVQGPRGISDGSDRGDRFADGTFGRAGDAMG